MCGLALDVCVVDTAINAKLAYPKKRVVILTDLCRPAHVPMFGGYLCRPDVLKAVAKQFKVELRHMPRFRIDLEREPGTFMRTSR